MIFILVKVLHNVKKVIEISTLKICADPAYLSNFGRVWEKIARGKNKNKTNKKKTKTKKITTKIM